MNAPVSVVTPAKVYASYNGSQLGVTVRDVTTLNQTTFYNTGFNINAIAAAPNGDMYLASANKIYRYSSAGALLAAMVFPDPLINYTGLTVIGSKIYASYNGSQLGISVRDAATLNQTLTFNTGFNISAVSAASNGDMYLTSANRIYRYSSTGLLLATMIFPDPLINYTGVAVIGNQLYASYNGSQLGISVRDTTTLNQTLTFNTGFNISAVAAASNGDMYLTSANRIYRYSSTGALLTTMIFPDPLVNYTGIAVAPAH